MNLLNCNTNSYSLKCLSAGTSSTPSQQELNDLRGVVTNLGDELTSQAECYRLLMEKCKQLDESNKMLTQSNQQLSQQMMSIDQRLQVFFQMQQVSSSGFEPPLAHHPQSNEDEDEDEDEDKGKEDDDPHLGD